MATKKDEKIDRILEILEKFDKLITDQGLRVSGMGILCENTKKLLEQGVKPSAPTESKPSAKQREILKDFGYTDEQIDKLTLKEAGNKIQFLIEQRRKGQLK